MGSKFEIKDNFYHISKFDLVLHATLKNNTRNALPFQGF